MEIIDRTGNPPKKLSADDYKAVRESFVNDPKIVTSYKFRHPYTLTDDEIDRILKAQDEYVSSLRLFEKNLAIREGREL